MSTSTAIGQQRRSGVDTWTHRAIVANLVGQIVIVLTGGIVRLTASGLGCSTWPMCEPGQFTPVPHAASSWHPFIEFGNRLLTGVLAVIGIAVAILVWRQRGRTLSFRLLGLVPLAGVVLQAVVGGLSVLTDLHPAWVGFHLLLSMALVWLSTMLLVRGGEGDGPAIALIPPSGRVMGWCLGVLIVPLLVLGTITTGAGPHSGDDQVGYRFALDPVTMARAHAGMAWLVVIVAVILVIWAFRAPAPRHTRRAGVLLLIVLACQGAIGYIQFQFGLPAPLVALHMLGAAGLVAAATSFVMNLRRREGVDA